MRLRWTLLLLLSFVTPAIAQTPVGTFSDTGPVLFPVNVSGQVDGMGRVCQVKFDPTDSFTMYAVSSSGGLYITHNNGVTWAPTPGTETLPTTQTASVCIDYTDHNILYLSTGDPDYYYEDYGIWKSTDGGTTWNMSNADIGYRMAVEMIMDPHNHNTIVAATDDGIWKTTDAGGHWTETLTGGDFRSMKMKPGSLTTMYAVTSTGYYRSTDMGDTWTNITTGIDVPSGNRGLRLAVSAADTNMVYIGTTDGYGEIMKSTDGGTTFSLIYSSDTQCIVCYDETVTSGSQGDYNFGLTANPLNANELLLVSHCVWRSTDGGLTWSKRTSWWNECHTDMHDIEFNPYNNNQRFNANDGGLWLSTDTLATVWAPRSDGLAATEMYHAAQSPLIRQMVSIGSQDNGEMYFDGVWKCNRGGDWGARCGFDYLGNATVYYDNGNRRNLLPLGGDYTYDAPFFTTNTFQIEFLPGMHNVSFVGTDSVWRSEDINTPTPSWLLMLPLSENVKDISSCHADSNILYVITDGGHLYRSDNALAITPTFTTLTTPSATDATASVATSKQNPNLVYIACNNNVYRSVNKGASWIDITGSLPALNVNKIIVDDYSANWRIFANLGSYVYYRDNTSTSWTLINGLPTVAQVTGFMVYNDSTAASIIRTCSYGRGVWECNINNNMKPAADFTANKQYICPGDTVRFSKNVYGLSSSFIWNFPGGTPSTSTADSPVVVYPSVGNYDVQFIAYGTTGLNDTVIHTSYINVSNGDATILIEGFEESTFPPTAEWNTVSESGNMWQHEDTVGGFGLSSKCMFFDNYDNDAGGRHDRIITPKIDLTTAVSAYVTFDVAYAYYHGYRDSLQVEVSTDCGKTFIPIYEEDSEVLSTAPDLTSSFIPDATQWRKDTINLDAYLGNEVQLAFDNIGHYGENLYIDNINLSSTLDVKAVKNTSNFQVYPNPATGEVTIKGTGLTGDRVVALCYNSLGQLVKQETIAVANGMCSGTMQLSALPRGVYEVNMQQANGRNATVRLVLQ